MRQVIRRRSRERHHGLTVAAAVGVKAWTGDHRPRQGRRIDRHRVDTQGQIGKEIEAGDTRCRVDGAASAIGQGHDHTAEAGFAALCTLVAATAV